MTGIELYEAVRTPDSADWRALPAAAKAYWGKRANKMSRNGVKVADIKKGSK